ncbi:MAG: hypothetical protein EXS08_07130 [Planctomycetes bacterium]|nr:hypothetical protein [Planctomycetota bacterium]
MKHLTQWILALLAVAAFASLSGAWTSVHAPASQEPKKERKLEKPGAGQGASARGGQKRAEKQAAIKKVLPTLKTSLSEAIVLAEKETAGKAFTAGIEILDGKALIQVNLFVNDKMVVASVDPETKKVTLPAKKEGAEEGEAEGGEGGG